MEIDWISLEVTSNIKEYNDFQNHLNEKIYTNYMLPKEKINKKTKPFQIRWKEALGKDDCIYGYRWVFIFFGYSIRVHKWIKSEPIAHQHDHVWNFLIITLFGGYLDISTNKEGKTIIDKVKTGSIRYRNADHIHNIVLAKNTVCWSLLLTSKPFKNKNWGFFVNNKKFRPLRYFSRYGYLKTCRDDN